MSIKLYKEIENIQDKELEMTDKILESQKKLMALQDKRYPVRWWEYKKTIATTIFGVAVAALGGGLYLLK